eukprot:CAMPEP_0176444886 /NCGR_PEP_ID=MMETSP0127-20121128/23339_1 /TAXON_ID=938130 /ORGANISM="Platyophrya macrostoma, Strain WH" /LENGTH=434 /DNA_ID=CAMNT_0017830499 /DNA_START=26 /DNA_END=1330 /DNA_ORIENTATION=-
MTLELKTIKAIDSKLWLPSEIDSESEILSELSPATKPNRDILFDLPISRIDFEQSASESKSKLGHELNLIDLQFGLEKISKVKPKALNKLEPISQKTPERNDILDSSVRMETEPIEPKRNLGFAFRNKARIIQPLAIDCSAGSPTQNISSQRSPQQSATGIFNLGSQNSTPRRRLGRILINALAPEETNKTSSSGVYSAEASSPELKRPLSNEQQAQVFSPTQKGPSIFMSSGRQSVKRVYQKLQIDVTDSVKTTTSPFDYDRKERRDLLSAMNNSILGQLSPVVKTKGTLPFLKGTPEKQQQSSLVQENSRAIYYNFPNDSLNASQQVQSDGNNKLTRSSSGRISIFPSDLGSPGLSSRKLFGGIERTDKSPFSRSIESESREILSSSRIESSPNSALRRGLSSNPAQHSIFQHLALTQLISSPYLLNSATNN